MFRQALANRRAKLGEGHPDTATSYGNAGSNLARQHRYDEAQPLFVRATEIIAERLGPDHPDLAKSFNNLGVNLAALGRMREAADFLGEAAAMMAAAHGEAHPDTIAARLTLGMHTMRGMGQPQPALDQFRLATEAVGSLYAGGHERAGSRSAFARDLHGFRYRVAAAWVVAQR